MQTIKESYMVDFYSPRGFFFIEHIDLHLCVKFQVNGT